MLDLSHSYVEVWTCAVSSGDDLHPVSLAVAPDGEGAVVRQRVRASEATADGVLQPVRFCDSKVDRVCVLLACVVVGTRVAERLGPLARGHGSALTDDVDDFLGYRPGASP